MTGNKIAWRAPLAGLASLAMVATMGVAAGTANAADVDKVTVSIPKADPAISTLAEPETETLADAIGAYGAAVDNAHMGGTSFAYWKNVETCKRVDFTATLASLDANNDGRVELAPVYLANAQLVGVNVDTKGATLAFPNLGEVNGTAEFFIPQNDTLPEYLQPVDVADGQIVTSWKVEGNGAQTSAAYDLSDLDVDHPQASITVTAVVSRKTKTVTFKTNGVANVAINGAKSDGVVDGDYTVDTRDGKVTAPTTYSTDKNAYAKVNSWYSASTTDQDEVNAGSEFTPGHETYLADKDTVTEEYDVVFDDNTDLDNNANTGDVQTVKVAKDGYVDEDQVKTPELDGYVFDGWWDLTSGDQYTFGKYAGDKITAAGRVLTAKWQKASKTVKVTFFDSEYKGSNKPVSVKVASDGYLKASDAPAWTRDGFYLSWRPADRNGNLAAGMAFADALKTLAVDVNNGRDFYFIAAWTEASEDDVAAALQYVGTGERIIPAGGDRPLLVTVDDSANFTPASFKAFKSVWDEVNKEYAQARYNAVNSKIDAKTSAKLVAKLAAAWQKLVFKATVSNDPAGAQATVRGLVHRLYNPSKDEHFYSSTTVEIQALTSTTSTAGGWNDEGVLFATAPTDANKKFANYDYATQGLSAEAKADVVANLTAASKPIIVEMARFYDQINGDHVWTAVDGVEYDALSADTSWNNEGTPFVVPTYTGSKDVVRQYQPAKSRHLLSTDPAEQKLNETRGWTTEGTAFKAY